MYCGDGIVQGEGAGDDAASANDDGFNEECDDANDDEEDGCFSDCTLSECNDQEDNDGDGVTDAGDIGCLNEDGAYRPEDDDEKNPSCSNGEDDDGDGYADDEDPNCHTNDDYTDEGSYDIFDDDEDGPVYECNDHDDNDNDGKSDKEDPGCHQADELSGIYAPTDDNEQMDVIISDHGLDGDEMIARIQYFGEGSAYAGGSEGPGGGGGVAGFVSEVFSAVIGLIGEIAEAVSGLFAE